MNDFHFLRPHLLFFFIPFFILGFVLLRTKFKTRIWNQICSSDLMPYVLNTKSQTPLPSYFLTFLVFTLLICALAGPTWQTIPTPLIKSQSGLVIALDLSKTMDSKDIKPSRLKRAIYKLKDILNTRGDGYTSLLVFSESPFVVTPMTDDVSTIKAMLPALETNIMPTMGHDPYKAIAKGIDLLNQAGISNGSILLITSELSKQAMERSIELAKQHHTKIYVLGVGTSQATPIQTEEGGLIKDEKGAVLISMLSKDNLNYLAQSTKGVYTTITPDDTDVKYLANKFNVLNPSDSHLETEMTQNKWHDQGYLLLLLALPFVSLFFRRGVLILTFFIVPYHLQALAWQDLWKTSDQQAEHHFHQEEFEQAKEKFQNLEWQAATHYKLGDFSAAADLYESDQTLEGLYNYGTAKAKQGDFEEALEAYKKALKIDPDHEDTLCNKKLIEDSLKKNENDQNSNDQQNDNDEQDKSDQQKNSDQNSQTDNPQNSQNSDSKTSDNSDNLQDSKNSNSSQNSENSNEQSANEQKQDEQKNSNSSHKSENSNEQSANEQKQGEQKNSNSSQNSENSNEPSVREQKQGEQKNKNKDSQSNKQNGKQKNQSQQSNEDAKLSEKKKKELQKEYQKQIEKELNKQKEQKPLKAQIKEKEMSKEEEQQQIDDRWLERIDDDPGGLLRRKFLLQSREQQ